MLCPLMALVWCYIDKWTSSLSRWARWTKLLSYIIYDGPQTRHSIEALTATACGFREWVAKRVVSLSRNLSLLRQAKCAIRPPWGCRWRGVMDEREPRTPAKRRPPRVCVLSFSGGLHSASAFAQTNYSHRAFGKYSLKRMKIACWFCALLLSDWGR